MIRSLCLKPFCRKDGKNVDDYIMCHEKCKVKIRRFKMYLREHMHELNLLCGAKAMFTSYRIGFCSVSQNYMVWCEHTFLSTLCLVSV